MPSLTEFKFDKSEKYDGGQSSDSHRKHFLGKAKKEILTDIPAYRIKLQIIEPKKDDKNESTQESSKFRNQEQERKNDNVVSQNRYH